MTLSSALQERLAASPVNAAVSGRIGWTKQLQALPSITMQVVADPRPQHFKGFQRVRPTTVQVDVWPATPEAAAGLREQIVEVLTPAHVVGIVTFQRAMVTNIRSGPEQVQPVTGQRLRGEVHRESIDFIFTHNAN